MSKKKEGPGDLWKRIRKFLEPETPQGVAALLGASVTPGVGFGVDVADAIAGIQDKDALRTGIATLGAMMPIATGASIRQLLKRVGLLERLQGVRTADDLFQKEAIERALAKDLRSGPNRTDVNAAQDAAGLTVGMHPEEFLAYAPELRRGLGTGAPPLMEDLIAGLKPESAPWRGWTVNKLENLIEMLERGQLADEIPQLWFGKRTLSAGDPYWQTLGHEGRHRAMIAAASGIETIPVQVMFGQRAGEAQNFFRPVGIETLLERTPVWPTRVRQELDPGNIGGEIWEVMPSLSRRNIESLATKGMPTRISPRVTVDKSVVIPRPQRSIPIDKREKGLVMGVGINPASIEEQLTHGIPTLFQSRTGMSGEHIPWYSSPRSGEEIIVSARSPDIGMPMELRTGDTWDLGVDSWLKNINTLKKGEARELLSHLARILEDLDPKRKLLKGHRLRGTGPGRMARIDLSKVRPPRPYRVGGAVNKEET